MVQLPMPDIFIDKSEDSRCGVGWDSGSRRSGTTALHASVATVALLLLCWVALGGGLVQPSSRGLERVLPEAPEVAMAAGSGGDRSGGRDDAWTEASGSEGDSSGGSDDGEIPGAEPGISAQEQAALTQERAKLFKSEFTMLKQHTLESRNHSDVPASDEFVAAARVALQGRPLLFVGDSVTRYQFLALAALLYSGRWNWSGTPTTNPRGWDLVNSVHKHSYGTWDEFFNVTTAIFEGAMECRDCYRETEVWNVTRIYERRIYDHDGIYLEFMELFACLGKDTFKFRSEESIQQQIPKTEAAMSLPAFMRWGFPLESQPSSRPAALVLNFGWHTIANSEPWPYHEIASLGETEQLRKTQLIWRQTTQGRSTHHDTPMLNAIKQWGKGHWQVLRARKTSKAVTDNDPTLFIDSVHFWRPVYALLNIELLQMLSEPC